MRIHGTWELYDIFHSEESLQVEINIISLKISTLYIDPLLPCLYVFLSL